MQKAQAQTPKAQNLLILSPVHQGLRYPGGGGARSRNPNPPACRSRRLGKSVGVRRVGQQIEPSVEVVPAKVLDEASQSHGCVDGGRGEGPPAMTPTAVTTTERIRKVPSFHILFVPSLILIWYAVLPNYRTF